MSEQRHLKVHFNDGTMLRFEFPAPESGGLGAAQRSEDLLNQRYLVVEVEGALLMLPVTSIKYIEVFPSPRNLPATVVRGARLVRSEG